MVAKLTEAFHKVCEKENGVRCIVLKSGVIGVFSAGADLKVGSLCHSTIIINLDIFRSV